MNVPSVDTSRLTFLAGGGEMGARMRELSWASTPLGSPETWPQSLRSTVSLLLPSKAQLVLFWGPEFVTLYNDAYRPVLGTKHPQALGQPGRETWREIWSTQLGAFEQGTQLRGPNLSPGFATGLTERLRVLRPEHRSVGIIVERDELGSPKQNQLCLGRQQQAHGAAQTLWPGFG